jgi:hypothetical protein
VNQKSRKIFKKKFIGKSLIFMINSDKRPFRSTAPEQGKLLLGKGDIVYLEQTRLLSRHSFRSSDL